MVKFLLELFVLYLVYKLIVDIILPIAQVTKKTKRMMDEMNQQQTNTTAKNSQQQTSSTTTKKHDDEYIDYEEVK
jgi:Sec-independent protein translocase protein TatA